jgi:two-component system, chemotaxis family, chemotaxis protein CheY
MVVDDEMDIQTLFELRFRREIKDGELEFIFHFPGKKHWPV